MKKNLYLSALLIGAFTFASCTKEVVDSKTTEPNSERFTLTANLNETTKTTADAAGKVSWLKTDTLAVFVKEVSSSVYGSLMKFGPKDNTKGIFETASTPAVEEGGEYDWSVIYPYKSLYTSPVNTTVYTKVGAATQTQTSTNNMAHIDGDMCPLVGNTQTSGTGSPTFEMKQASSILKFNIKNEGTTDIKVSKITFTTAATKIAGTFYIDFSDINNLNYVSSGDNYTYNEVVLNVSTDGTIAPGTTGSFYMVVCPTTLPASAKNTIVINAADGSTCTKEWVPSSASTLEPGKYKNINLTYTKDASNAGAALPFEDDFSWVENSGASDSSTALKAADYDNYSDFAYAYAAANGGALKIGSSSATGNVITKSLDLSSPFTVLVDIRKYSSDGGKVVISVDGIKLLEESPESSSKFKTIAVYSSSGYTSSSKVSITTSAKRAYIDNLRVVAGDQLPDASISIITNEVTVNNATSADGTSAVVNGSYTTSFLKEGQTVTVGFEYKTASTSWTSVTATTAASFTASLTDLTCGTEYIVRAWGCISGGEKTYGEERSFTPAKQASGLIYTLTFPKNGSNSAYANNYDVTISDIMWSAPGNQYDNGIVRVGGKSLTNAKRVFYSKTAITSEITKIEIEHGALSGITINSMNVSVHSTATGAANGTSNVIESFTPTFSANNTITCTKAGSTNWTNAFYRIEYTVTVSGTSNKYFEFKSAKFYKE